VKWVFFTRVPVQFALQTDERSDRAGVFEGEFEMKSRILTTSAIALAVTAVAQSGMLAAKESKVPAAPAGPAAPAAFTDSSAAQLAGTKRVAITSVIIQFQAATNAVDGPSDWFRMFQSKATSETVLAWPDFDEQMQREFAEFAYAKLQADLTAAGFEVVPEAQVKASANYAAILKEGAIPHHTQYGNAMGDAYFVGAPSLQPYLPYSWEGGIFANPVSYIGWTTKFGAKSRTAGGPSIVSVGDNWKIPGMETALAKELNAHVVKAVYVVTLGRAVSQRKRSLTVHSSSVGYGTHSSEVISATANAYAEPSLMADQTHISFRTANGSGKWQKVSLTKIAPPKDGDVSVTLATSLTGSTDYFDLTNDGGKTNQSIFFDSPVKIKFTYFAHLKDPVGYMEEVGAMISEANGHMLGLVKQ
jgi:hypothetical protein